MYSDHAMVNDNLDAVSKKPDDHKKYRLCIPMDELLRKTYSEPKRITQSDVFLSHKPLKMFSSLFSTEEDKLPKYMIPYRDIINQITDISEEEMENINKCQLEREHLARDKELLEAKKIAEKEAVDLQIKNTLDNRVDKLMRKHKFFVKRTCPVKIPYKSTLTHQEHEFYLRSFIKFQIRPFQTKHEEEEYKQYLSLQHKLFLEQECLMNFSHKVSQLVLKEYNTIPQNIENYIKKCIYHRCHRALSYPQHFTSVMGIPIKPRSHDGMVSSFQLKYLGHLLSLGLIPVIKIPYIYARNFLPMDESVESKRRPDVDAIFDQNAYLYKCPVSKDMNAEFLAKEHEVNIVMSASSFKTIVDNQEQSFDKYWNIPVEVKSYTVKDEHGKEKHFRVVYIDKPLPKKSWYPLEIKASFFKQAALGRLTYVYEHQAYRMKTPVVTSSGPEEGHGRNQNVYDDDIFGSTNESVPDLFGSDFGSPKLSNKSNQYFSCGKRGRSLSYNKVAPPSYGSFNRSNPYYHSPNSKTSEEAAESNIDDDLFLTDDDEEDGSQPPPKLKNKKNPAIKRLSESNTTSPESQSTSKFQNNNNNKIPELHYLKSPKQDAISQSQSPSSQMADANSTKSPPKSPYSTESNSKFLKSAESLTKTSGLLDNLLDMQSSCLKQNTVAHFNYKQSSAIPSNLLQFEENDNKSQRNQSRNVPKPWSTSVFTDWSKCKDLKECPSNRSHTANVHYQLFSFENTCKSPSKESEPLKVIVRHNIHGMSRCDKKKKSESQKQSKAYIIYPKIENQVYFGAEVNSNSEITQQWASLVVRPNTTLLQIRVCVASGSVVITEERTLDAVLKEGKQAHINFDPQVPFATLNALFRCFTKMESGKYMIHHSSKTAAFISVMKETDSNRDVSHSSFDVHNIYKDGSIQERQYVESPWLHIDTHVLTPFHIVHKKIPGTFPMNNPGAKLNKKQRKKKTQAANKKKSIDDEGDSKQVQTNKRKAEEQLVAKSKRRYF